MPENLAGATPGRERIIHFSVNGHTFAFRRPSSGDWRVIKRRYGLKIGASGIPADTDLMSSIDGAALMWEARLEVGLTPRDGKNLGECAPSHWLENGAVSFAEVDQEEVDQVCEYLAQNVFTAPVEEELASLDRRILILSTRREALLAAKKSQQSPASPTASSGNTADAPTSA